MAFRPGHHSVGCQGAFPAANPIPGAKPCRWPIPLLGAVCLQRPSANRRSPVDDLCPAISCPCPGQCRTQPLGGRYHRVCHALCQRCGADLVVPRSELALGGRPDRGVGLLPRRINGLAHPAHRPGAEPCLPAAGIACLRSRPGARLHRLRHRRRHGSGRHRARPRSGGAARCVFPWRICHLAHRHGDKAARRPARGPAAAGRSGALSVGSGHHPHPADCSVRRGFEPAGHRLHRRRPRLVAPGLAADVHCPRHVRRRRPDGGLLGSAELCLAAYRPVHCPEYGRNVHRRLTAAAARLGGFARRPLQPRDPLLHRRSLLDLALRLGLVHAGL